MRLLLGSLSLSLCFLLIPIERAAAQINPVHSSAVQHGLGATPYLDQPYSIFIQGQYAYIISFTTNSLEIVDITNPFAPQHKGSIINGEGGALLTNSTCVFVQGKYAYVTSVGNNSLEIIDVSDPSAPVHKGSIVHGQGGALLNTASSVAVSGNYAYVASVVTNALEIIDVSDPSNPVHKASLTNITDGSTATQASNLAQITVSGGYVYFGGNDAVEIVDVKNPAQPVKVGRFVDGTSGTAGPTKPNSIEIVGNYAYVTWSFYSSGFSDFEIIDITNPAAPVHKSSVISGAGGKVFTTASTITVSGSYAYIGGSTANNVLIYNISDPTNPVFTGSIADGAGGASLNGPRGLKISGNYAYTIGFFGQALEVLDVSNPAAPKHKSLLKTGINGAAAERPLDVFISGHYAYLTSASIAGSHALQIVDIIDPERPVPVSTVFDGEGGAKLTFPRSVQVVNGYAYVIGSTSKSLEILDVTNPAAPVHKSTVVDGNGAAPYLNNAFSVFVKGNYAYVASFGSNALQIIDISNPASPVVKGSLLDGGGVAPYLLNASSVHVVGNYAYVTSYGRNALEIIDVSNVNTPVHKASLLNSAGGAALAGASQVVVSGNYAYVVSINSNALEVIDITNPLAPLHAGKFLHGTNGVQMDSPISLTVDGQYVFVTGYSSNTLVIFDISTPSTPAYVASLSNGQGGALLNLPQAVATSGNYAFVASNWSAGMDIIYLYGSKITGFNPPSAAIGSTVTVTGQNFNTLMKATLNGMDLPISNVTNSSMTVVVPPDANNGKIRIIANKASTSTVSDFLVIPTATNVDNINQTSVTAHWSDVGATTYYIDASTDNFATTLTAFSNLAVNNVTSYVIDGLTAGSTYQYRVRSSTASASSGNSNAISFTTIPTVPTADDATAVGQSGFVANWTLSPGATSYYLDVAYDDAFVNFVAGYNNLVISGNNVTSQTVGGLSPYTSCYYRLRAAIASGSSASSNVVSVRTLDLAPPLISPASTPNATTVTLGNTPILNVSITDNVGLEKTTVYYRGISKSSFKSADLQGPGGAGGNYSVTVQGTWYDSLGMEYYFAAEDHAANKTRSESSFIQLVTPSISLPSLPSGNDFSDYRIIAFPYQLATDNKVTTVYSGVPWSDDTAAALWWWDQSANNNTGAYQQYAKPGSFEAIDPGKGYWAITRTSVVPQLSNVSAPKYNSENLFSITLTPGWNMIGNPYPVAISWDNVIDYNKNNGINTVSPLTVYDGGGYKSATGNIQLKPFEGGFVKNSSASDVVIRIPFNGQTSSGRTKRVGTDLSAEEWRISVNIRQNNFTNELGGIGMYPSARVGLDEYDNFNPPGLIDEPEIDFSDPSEPSRQYSFQAVPSAPAYRWRFKPSGKDGTFTELTWNDDITTSGDQQIFLLDEETLIVVDMTKETQYTFKLSSKTRFSIFYGKDVEHQISSEHIAVASVYPNPVKTECFVNIGLPEDARVSLQIFDLQGALMKQGDLGVRRGIQKLKILDESNTLSPGVYVYKISIQGSTASSFHTGKIVKQ